MSLRKIGLLGASGRMGQAVQALLQTSYKDRASLVAKVSQDEDFSLLRDVDVVIDFSSPLALELVVQIIPEWKNPPAFVIGTTGFSGKSPQSYEILAKHTRVLISPNFSIGVFLMSEILKEFSRLFMEFGYQPAIVERHHVHKKDIPSGTAKLLQKAIAPVYSEKIPIQSVRAGAIVGEHEVSFYNEFDQLLIHHRANDRTIFAQGALECALWLINHKTKGPALLTMADFFQNKRTTSELLRSNL